MFGNSIFDDKLLFGLAIGIIFLAIAAFAFAFYAVNRRLRNIRTSQYWARLEQEWEPAILGVLSREDPEQVMWDRVRDEDELYFIDFLLRYARRVGGDERVVLAQLARPYLPKIHSRGRTGDAERRARSVQTLSVLGINDYIDEIIAALDDPSPLVAMTAARALMRREHPEYAPEVLRRLHRFTTWSSHYLASMLSAVGPQIAADVRRLFLNPDADTHSRSIAAEALAELNDLASAEAAVQVIENEDDHDLVGAALRLLGRIGLPTHLDRVRQLCRSRDFVIRIHALTALGQLGHAEDIPVLREALDDQSPWVARHAADGIRNLGGTEVLRQIAESDHPRSGLAREMLAEDLR